MQCGAHHRKEGVFFGREDIVEFIEIMKMNSRVLALEGGGRKPHHLSEDLGEIADIIEAIGNGDIGDLFIGGEEPFDGGLQSLLGAEGIDRNTVYALEQMAHIVIADIDLFGDLFNSDVFGQMSVDIGDHPLDQVVFKASGVGSPCLHNINDRGQDLCVAAFGFVEFGDLGIQLGLINVASLQAVQFEVFKNRHNDIAFFGILDEVFGDNAVAAFVVHNKNPPICFYCIKGEGSFL